MSVEERPVTVICGDCGGESIVRSRGNIPQRCDECRLKRHRKRTRLRNRERRQTGARPDRVFCGDCGKLVWVPGTVGGVPRYCRSCAKEREHQQRAVAYRRHHLKKNYRISEAEYNAVLEFQDGACAICKRIPNGKFLAVDHDHKTGKVRGLLCHSCNLALGGFEDNQQFLHSAFLYVSRFRSLFEVVA